VAGAVWGRASAFKFNGELAAEDAHEEGEDADAAHVAGDNDVGVVRAVAGRGDTELDAEITEGSKDNEIVESTTGRIESGNCCFKASRSLTSAPISKRSRLYKKYINLIFVSRPKQHTLHPSTSAHQDGQDPGMVQGCTWIHFQPGAAGHDQ
jgi:hypothetical protein